MSSAHGAKGRSPLLMDHGLSRCLKIAKIFNLLFLAACMPANEKFIQGLWYYDNVESLTNPGAYHIPYEDWEEFTFERGNYRFESCCNRRVNDTGGYTVASIEGNEIVIDLIGETGNEFTDGTELKIIILKEWEIKNPW
jgi:hypothetical protein